MIFNICPADENGKVVFFSAETKSTFLWLLADVLHLIREFPLVLNDCWDSLTLVYCPGLMSTIC